MPIVTKQIREGPRFAVRILGVAERNNEGRLIFPTVDFFHEAEAREPRDLLKLTAHLTQLAEAGTIHDPDKFKPLRETAFWELRTQGGLRLILFRNNTEFICTNGVIKKRDDLPDAALETANRWRNWYLDARNKSHLTHEPEHINQFRRIRQRR